MQKSVYDIPLINKIKVKTTGVSQSCDIENASDKIY